MIRMVGKFDFDEFVKEKEWNLPSQFYRDPAIYELERRAIFSKKWFLLTHQCHFAKSGDFVNFSMAGFNFFVIQDREGRLQGHHNVCRHVISLHASLIVERVSNPE